MGGNVLSPERTRGSEVAVIIGLFLHARQRTQEKASGRQERSDIISRHGKKFEAKFLKKYRGEASRFLSDAAAFPLHGKRRPSPSQSTSPKGSAPPRSAGQLQRTAASSREVIRVKRCTDHSVFPWVAFERNDKICRGCQLQYKKEEKRKTSLEKKGSRKCSLPLPFLDASMVEAISSTLKNIVFFFENNFLSIFAAQLSIKNISRNHTSTDNKRGLRQKH